MAKTIMITGASSGIGAYTAEYLSKKGYQLVLVARNEERLKSVADKLEEKYWIIPFDLLELERIEEIFQICSKQNIKLDGLVHSAGVTGITPVRKNNIEEMKNMMTINYFAFMELAKYFSQRKYSNDGGSIIAISSIASVSYAKGMANYTASKAAVNAAVKVVAKELAHRRIRVNALMPANIKTPMTDNLEEYYNWDNQIFGFIEIEQFANLVEYLLSDMSQYITGANIPISGGAII